MAGSLFSIFSISEIIYDFPAFSMDEPIIARETMIKAIIRAVNIPLLV